MRRILLRRLAIAGLLLGLAGCDLLDVFLEPPEADPNDRVAVGTVLQAPSINVDGVPVLSELTVANVFVGQRGPGADILLVPPDPLVGARVTLTMIDDSVIDVSLPHLEEGMYMTTSSDDATLEYRTGAQYRTTIVEGGITYEMDVERAPAPEEPQGIPDVHGLNQPLVVTWTPRRTGLVEVYRITAGGAVQTFTNRPADIRELVHLALQREPEDPRVEIPGTAFQSRGTYVAVLFVMRRGFPDSGLFAGSTLMVGAGESRVFQVD
jgi:hypothetical protein